jgi:hypothetical protein
MLTYGCREKKKLIRIKMFKKLTAKSAKNYAPRTQVMIIQSTLCVLCACSANFAVEKIMI